MLWIPRSEGEMPSQTAARWAARLEISEHLARFLWKRGLQTEEDAAFFLNPGLRRLASLDLWPGLTEAAGLLADKLLAGAKVAVWGDYDVDGITSTALIRSYLTAQGFDSLHHIPNRLTEGYGLNKAAIDNLAGAGATVLLTVDCGISDLAEVAHARSLGLTVIITDHHLPGESVPVAEAIINPRLGNCPCPSLAGVGVAFMFVAALNAELAARGRPRLDLREYLDLVALGTLADMVDLSGQNRILVKNGLLKISQGARIGLAALKSSCSHSPTATLDAAQVVFSLAPRINAAGRLGSSEQALELLLTTDRAEATELAARLSCLNAQRKGEEDRIIEEAMSQAGVQADENRLGLVLYAPGWHPGVIGIVASRVVDRFARPVVVFSEVDHVLKGSGRSISKFDLHGALGQCQDLCITYGGHRMAAGVAIEPLQLDAFRSRFWRIAGEAFNGVLPERECKVDGELPFSLAADFTWLKELEMLQPFGMGNPEPVFSSPPVTVKSMRPKPGLMLLDLDDGEGRVLRAKAWRRLSDMPLTLRGKKIRVAYTPRIDRYNGMATIELLMRDWKIVE